MKSPEYGSLRHLLQNVTNDNMIRGMFWCSHPRKRPLPGLIRSFGQL
jgi:hypothetical protein